MPDTVKPLAAQIPFSSDGIIQHISVQASSRLEGITWSQDRVPKECCFRSKNHASPTLEESQMSCTCVSCWLEIPPPEDCMDKHPLFEQDQ